VDDNEKKVRVNIDVSFGQVCNRVIHIQLLKIQEGAKGSWNGAAQLIAIESPVLYVVRWASTILEQASE